MSNRQVFKSAVNEYTFVPDDAKIVFEQSQERDCLMQESPIGFYTSGSSSSSSIAADTNENDSVSSSDTNKKRQADFENDHNQKKTKFENCSETATSSSAQNLESDEFETELSFDFLQDILKELESGIIPPNPLEGGPYLFEIDMTEFDNSDKLKPTLNDLLKSIPFLKKPGEFNLKDYRKNQRITVSLTCIQAVPKFKIHHHSPLYSPEETADNSEDVCNSGIAGRHAAGTLATATMKATAEIVFILGNNLTHFPEWGRERMRTGLHNHNPFITCFYKVSLYKSPKNWIEVEPQVNKVLEKWVRYKIHTCEVIRKVVLLQKQIMEDVPNNYSHLGVVTLGEQHYIKQPGNLDHKCKICEKIFKDHQSLHIHKFEHPELCHDCESCGVKLVKREMVLVKGTTKESKIPGAKHQCDPAAKEMFLMNLYKSKLGLEFIPVEQQRPHVCPQCSLGFSTKVLLNRHVKETHGEKTHMCSHCPRGFGSKRLLNEHVKRRHTQAPQQTTNTNNDATKNEQ